MLAALHGLLPPPSGESRGEGNNRRGPSPMQVLLSKVRGWCRPPPSPRPSPGGRGRSAALVLLLLAAPPAYAQKSEDTLRIAWRDAVPDVDPYHNTLRTGLILAHHAWDTLIFRDPETLQLKPLLATSWRYLDPMTLEFELRPGVTFHDGSPFTADDVVYTVAAALSEAVAVPSNYSFLAGAERVDDLRVRIRLKRVFPAALEYIAMVLPILPRAYRERVGTGYSAAPFGTGPYRITRVDGLSAIGLERNDAYFDGPKGKPAIRRLEITEVADTAAELAALVDGRADWIWQFGPEQLDALARTPGVQTLRQESMRFAYLNMDAAGRTGAGPLTQLKVRQAIMHAVDRATLARQFMPGGSRVLDAPCFPTQFGCEQAIAAKYEYDPAKARALLAEAGYPDGFDTDLVGYLLPAWQDALRGYLAAVGIRAAAVNLQAGPALARSMAGRNPLDAGSWGSYSINDASASLPVFFTFGEQDYARDGDVRDLLLRGGGSTDPDIRRDAYRQAIRRITEGAYTLPLFTYVTTYAVSRNLVFKPFTDELPRFYLSSWR